MISKGCHRRHPRSSRPSGGSNAKPRNRSTKNTDLLTVVREFDFSEAEVYKVGAIEWNARYGYESLVRAFYCKELADFTTEELHEYLANAERARTLGFEPDQFAPGKTAPGRTTPRSLGGFYRVRRA
jgi:hypothetical protein